MLNVQEYTEEEYMRLQTLVFELAHEFRDEWEADPFGEPEILEYMQKAEEQGNADARDELAHVLETYIIYFAPEPKLTDEQYDVRMDKIKEFVSDLGSESQTDGGERSTN